MFGRCLNWCANAGPAGVARGAFNGVRSALTAARGTVTAVKSAISGAARWAVSPCVRLFGPSVTACLNYHVTQTVTVRKVLSTTKDITSKILNGAARIISSEGGMLFSMGFVVTFMEGHPDESRPESYINPLIFLAAFFNLAANCITRLPLFCREKSVAPIVDGYEMVNPVRTANDIDLEEFVTVDNDSEEDGTHDSSRCSRCASRCFCMERTLSVALRVMEYGFRAAVEWAGFWTPVGAYNGGKVILTALGIDIDSNPYAYFAARTFCLGLAWASMKLFRKAVIEAVKTNIKIIRSFMLYQDWSALNRPAFALALVAMLVSVGPNAALNFYGTKHSLIDLNKDIFAFYYLFWGMDPNWQIPEGLIGFIASTCIASTVLTELITSVPALTSNFANLNWNFFKCNSTEASPGTTAISWAFYLLVAADAGFTALQGAISFSRLLHEKQGADPYGAALYVSVVSAFFRFLCYYSFYGTRLTKETVNDYVRCVLKRSRHADVENPGRHPNIEELGNEQPHENMALVPAESRVTGYSRFEANPLFVPHPAQGKHSASDGNSPLPCNDEEKGQPYANRLRGGRSSRH